MELAVNILGSAPGPQNINCDNHISWCICGKCREMGNPVENVCCKSQIYITNHENFLESCVNHIVLTLAIWSRADVRANLVEYSPASYHKAAIPTIYPVEPWLFSVPSCVVWAIRHWYPFLTGLYMCFKEY